MRDTSWPGLAPGIIHQSKSCSIFTGAGDKDALVPHRVPLDRRREFCCHMPFILRRVTRSRDLGVVELMRLHEGLVCLNYTAKAWTEPGTVTRRRTLSLCYHYPCSLRLAGLFQPALMPFFASSPPAARPFGCQLLLSVPLVRVCGLVRPPGLNSSVKSQQ
jgi:hypothetical protein